ncbi:Variable outer membrane protein (plasmid) [Borrelia crocidurae DOU]|uniref:Variable outer membrane protein n=1 Tax=Borrelia crocidurae DOU TaxID=1293575 RepID=W5SJV2_9SPIR|nr:Vsp/OspC family lipoprotein [Borrelia crocidurae]AHH07217.1 Variable outer membrane protein [Borrelia crocidurae DOU]
MLLNLWQNVKEIESLIKSINELVKAVGKKLIPMVLLLMLIIMVQ